MKYLLSFLLLIFFGVEADANDFIIRKTKRSEKIKRSVLSRKTKCSFLGSPQYKKRLRFLWGVSCFLSFFSNIQVKLHALITFK